MRLLILTPLYPPAVGGAATYYGSVAERLAARAAITAVYVLTERVPGAPRTDRRGKLHVLRHLPRHVGSGRSTPWRAASYARLQLWFGLHLAGLVRRHRLDVVHFHTRFGGRALHAVLRRTGVPVVADVRDRRRDARPLAAVAARVLCCGEAIRRHLETAGLPASRIVSIPNPVPACTRPTQTEVAAVRRRHGLGEAPYVLFLGDVVEGKGIFTLLDGYARWCAGSPPARLVIAGRDLEGRRFAARLRAAPGVTYLGPVPHGEALALAGGAAIVVLPSLSEGLPTVILEALALGVRVICPPGVPEFERHLPDCTLRHVDADAVAQRLAAVWAHPGVPSYPLALHDPDRAVDALEAVYRTLLEGAAPTPPSTPASPSRTRPA